MTYTPYDTQPRLRPADESGRPSKATQATQQAWALVGKFQSACILWSNRRAIFKLARLEDRYLHDIGVSRADVDWALAQPWHVDPSFLLNERISKRRAAARWARGFSVL